ncbi:MAG: DUF4349 domain-containing protein [Actinobacteria bacterium]|nr:DUF4349 domain-containing protein [Actinomycetota bacterium]
MSEQMLRELRAEKPAAPAELRERVRTIAATEPRREPFLARLQWRRLVLVAPVTLVVAVAAAGVIGLTRGDTTGADEQAASGEATLTTQSLDAARNRATTDESLEKFGAPQAGGGVVPPSPGRLQRYEAELRLRVDDVEALSSATKRAQRIATGLGGHVASLSYDAPASGVGAAQITLRVPTSRIQSAVAQLSELGTILRQRYGIEDLQPQVDSLQAQIEDTQRQIARLVRQLRNRNLGDEERAILQSRLTDARRTLTELQQGLRGTRAEGQLGTVFLALTTERIEAAAKDGDGALDRIVDILRWEGMALLFALVVVGPFLLLGLLIWYALRLRRRREEARLLAQ